MRRHFSTWFSGVIVALGLAVAGCETTKLPPIMGSSSVTLDANTRRQNITTKYAAELTVELPPPKQAGAVWQIMQNDTRYLRPLSEVTAPAPETGRSTIHFHAIASGRSALRFIAVPAAEKNAETTPVDSYNVLVTIQPPPEKK
jgi:hypothetical protein